MDMTPLNGAALAATVAPHGPKNEPAWPKPHSDDSAAVEALIDRWQTHQDEGARSELLRRHHRFLQGQAIRHIRRWKGCEYADAFQAASIGFIRALDTYDPNAPAGLETYAGHWVRHELAALIRHRGPVSIGGNVLNDAYAVRSAARRLVLPDGRYPDIPDLAAHLQWREGRVQRALEAFNPANSKSLDTPLGGDDDDGATGKDLLVDSSLQGRPADVVEERLDRASAREAIAEAAECLNDREREVFQHRMVEGRKGDEVGRLLGVTRQSISLVEQKVRQKLQAALRRDDPRVASLLTSS